MKVHEIAHLIEKELTKLFLKYNINYSSSEYNEAKKKRLISNLRVILEKNSLSNPEEDYHSVQGYIMRSVKHLLHKQIIFRKRLPHANFKNLVFTLLNIHIERLLLKEGHFTFETFLKATVYVNDRCCTFAKLCRGTYQ